MTRHVFDYSWAPPAERWAYSKSTQNTVCQVISPRRKVKNTSMLVFCMYHSFYLIELVSISFSFLFLQIEPNDVLEIFVYCTIRVHEEVKSCICTIVNKSY